jgi:membrane peptidoglycan carboxypeptidase
METGVGYGPRKRPDDTLAPKLISKSFTLAGKAMVLVGKPLYLLLSYIVIAFLLLLHITGHFVRVILTNLFQYLISLAYTLLINLPLAFYQFSKTKLEKTKGKRVKLFKSLLTSARSTISSFSKKIILAFGRLTFLLQTTIKLITGLLKTVRQLAFYLQRRVSDIKPGVKLSISGLRLRLKLARFASHFLRIRVPKAKFVILTASAVFVILIPLAAFFWTVIFYELPSPEILNTRNIEVSTKIYDRNGILLYKIFKDQNRTPVALSEIPHHVRLATIAIEDAEFYNHPGFSVRGIVRAIIKNARSGKITGGSTITQQLVKNALLTPEKTIIRKLREIVLSVRVEFTFSKDEILEMYLNEVAYGGTAYGIQEAARVYFNKDVDQLSLAEAALLTGLPKSPTKFSPFGSNPDLVIARQKRVLDLMVANGYISERLAEEAKKEELTFAPNKTDIKAPHFVMFTRQSLEEKYGKEVVEVGGLEVITTLDYRIQKMAEEIVGAEVEKLASLNVGNGAAFILDTQTGEILAMVGSKDYFDTESDGNVNVTTRQRQPGSSIKIVNYAYALSNGYTPVTILSDTPVTFAVPGQPPYSPRNYDGKFRGKLTLRSAFAESRNVPAVKVLASYGVNKMIQMGRKMGITTWNNQSRFGLSLTLGGGDVTLLDLSRAYATIANYGRRPDLISVLKVTNYKGKVLEENECASVDQVNLVNRVNQEKQNNLINLVNSVNLINSAYATESAYKTAEAATGPCEDEQVLDPRVAYLLIDILRDNKARSPAFGNNSLLVIPGHSEVAVKTGTSNNLRDNWTIGFNQKYLVAVWVGNNDNSPMSRVASGITGATPIFNKIMTALLAHEENHPWEVPTGLIQLPICPVTGTLACEGCPVKMEWFLKENTPTSACSPEWFKEGEEQEEKEKEGLPRDDLSRDEVFREVIRGQILEEAVQTKIIIDKKKKRR